MPTFSNTANAPNRKDTRDTLYNLLLPLASGDFVQAVINGTPGEELNVQSPSVIVLSAGAERPPFPRGTAQNDNKFFLTVSIWVARDTPTADDVIDTIEVLIANVISANRDTPPWHMITSAGPSAIIPTADRGGVKFHVEPIAFIASVW